MSEDPLTTDAKAALETMRTRVRQAKAALEKLEDARTLDEMKPLWAELGEFVDQATASYAPKGAP